jgi:NADH-quinone oxidoreductase subunit M
VFGLSSVAIVYTSLVALMQDDMKKLIAYSSVAHMGFVTMGMFAFNRRASPGAVIQMLSHGIVSARCSSASASSTTGCTRARSTATAGSPTTCRTVLHVLHDGVDRPARDQRLRRRIPRAARHATNTWVALVHPRRRLYAVAVPPRVFGKLDKADVKAMPDLSLREVAILLPIALATLWMGIAPGAFLRPLHVPVTSLLDRLERANPGSEP